MQEPDAAHQQRTVGAVERDHQVVPLVGYRAAADLLERDYRFFDDADKRAHGPVAGPAAPDGTVALGAPTQGLLVAVKEQMAGSPDPDIRDAGFGIARLPGSPSTSG